MTKPTGRPRGRPPGATNIPSIEAFVHQSLEAPPAPPPIAPKKKPRGPWSGMTAEQRSEHSKRLAALKKGPAGGRRPGVPAALTNVQFDALVAEQEPIIERIIRKMAANGELPDDPDVVEAFRQTMKVLRTQRDPKTKIAAARLILDFKKAKPTTKVDVTHKTAEDYLDELSQPEE